MPAKPRATVPTEAEVLRQCQEVLAAFGVDCARQNTGVGTYANADGSERRVRYGRPGAADLSGQLSDGRRLEIEVKKVGKRPTDAQLDRLQRTNAGGGVGIWIDDSRELARVLPMLLAGARIEIEPNGDQWITTEEIAK